MTQKGEGYLVVCPGCKKKYHETTEHYTDAEISNGSMFRLVKKYGPKGFNWSSFPNNKAMKRGDLECPACGVPYCRRDNKVIVVPDPTLEPPEYSFECPYCANTFKSAAGLKSHIRSKHADE